ncbi:zinc-dependent alcohol dehydrogenase [Paenibacillus hamazuiensis]|uniref:zinc-dependent alcohol dehydrogenase n=1 Tax=Paenibacillus hamazuiensis TaxID=2936508 RepID=UPI00200E08C6|nr:alcohol dehydrogenase catalytic domain-containing protein [Paenibacillus hamazuiensis]
MKAGLYVGEKTVQSALIDKPIPGEGEALIRVAYAGICGTDMMVFSGKHPRAKAPLVMGHEFSGIIESIADHVSFKPGDRVTVEPYLTCGRCAACRAGQYHVCATLKCIGIDKNGGFSEYVAVPVDRLHHLPDNVSDDEAALVEPLAIAVHTVRRSNLKVGDSVAILGAGPIGLLIGLVAKQAGASEIFISDISPFRLQFAKELGFICVNAKETNIKEVVLARTDGIGADVVFEVAGTQSTAKQMVECIKFQGTIVVVSVYKQAPVVDLAAMHFREISLTTTRCANSNDFATAIQFMEKKLIDVRPLISHRLPIEQIKQGFGYMENTEISMKVLFHL